jgi:hypothetical protein
VRSGARRGELLALTWTDDVALEAGTLEVRRSRIAVQTDHGRRVYDKAKSKSLASRRTITLDAHNVHVLKTHKRQQDAERLAAGVAWIDEDRVFCQEDGTGLDPDRISAQFTDVCDEAKVRRVRLHDTRHGMATLMQMRGVASDATHRRMCNPHGRPRSAVLASSPFVLSEHSARRSAWSGAASAPRDATDATSRRPDPCHWLHHRCTNLPRVVPRSTALGGRQGVRPGPLQLQSSVSRTGGSRRSLSVLVHHLPGARDAQGLRAAHGGSTPLRALPAPNQRSSGCRAPRGRATCSSSRCEPRLGSVTSTAHVNNAGDDWSRYAAALAHEAITDLTE